MKSKIFAIVGFLAISAFAADNYTISNFSGDEVGTPDSYIDAEFGGSLKTSTSGTVENVQSGRFYVRQKFEDPFGESPTTYQLYEGREGSEKSSLSAFTLPMGIAYGFVVKAKVYPSADADANADVEKVYFDGSSVYVEGASQLFVHRGVKVIELVPANAPESSSSVEESSSSAEDAYAAAAVSSSSSDDDEYCDDDDPDCEEEYDVQGDVTSTANDANDDYYATRDASNDVTDRFGVADEVRKWSAWGLVAVAAAGIGMGIYNQMQYSDAKSAHDDWSDNIDNLKKNMKASCGGDEKCYQALLYQDPEGHIANSKKTMNKNKDTMDSYGMARNIWFGVAAASIAGSIVLFTW